jgi:hypothetical protein
VDHIELAIAEQAVRDRSRRAREQSLRTIARVVAEHGVERRGGVAARAFASHRQA